MYRCVNIHRKHYEESNLVVKRALVQRKSAMSAVNDVKPSRAKIKS